MRVALAQQTLLNPQLSPHTFSIKPSRLFRTGGYKFYKEESTSVNKSYLLHYPLAALSVDILPFYLSPTEFDNIPPGRYAEEVLVKITPKANRCIYSIGPSFSSTANDRESLLGITGLALNYFKINRELICFQN